jgi:PAS domain-containing protein
MSEAQMRGQEIMDPTWGTIFPDGRPMGGDEMPSTVALRTGEPVIEPDRWGQAPRWWRAVAEGECAGRRDLRRRESKKWWPVLWTSQLRKTISASLKRRRTLLRDVIETIPDAVVAFDSHDRLIMCNHAYRSNYADTAPAIEDGVTFREMLMHGLDIGLYADAGDTPEQQERWLKRRLESYRNPKSILVEKLTDGRWVQIRERVSDERCQCWSAHGCDIAETGGRGDPADRRYGFADGRCQSERHDPGAFQNSGKCEGGIGERAVRDRGPGSVQIGERYTGA